MATTSDRDGWTCVENRHGTTVCVDAFDDGSANLHGYWPDGRDWVVVLDAADAATIARALRDGSAD